MKVYRSYESKYPNYGSNSNGLWVAEDIDYCKNAIINGNYIVSFDFDIKNAKIADSFDLSHFLVDEDGNEIDSFDCVDIILNLYDDPFFINQIFENGYNCLFYDDPEGGYMWYVMDKKLLSNPQIVIKKKDLSLKEETNADSNSEHNPYQKKWQRQKDVIRDYVVQYGSIMQSMENGKTYKVLRDNDLSNYLGIEYAYCVQYDKNTMKPIGTVYLRSIDTFTTDFKNTNYVD